MAVCATAYDIQTIVKRAQWPITQSQLHRVAILTLQIFVHNIAQLKYVSTIYIPRGSYKYMYSVYTYKNYLPRGSWRYQRLSRWRWFQMVLPMALITDRVTRAKNSRITCIQWSDICKQLHVLV